MNQFAGHEYYDNSAVCLTCKQQHLLARHEGIDSQQWLDWQHKHKGHETFIVPTRVLSTLGEQVALAHNASVKIAYAASAEYTITLTGLATSSTLLAGRESTAVSNASNLYLDELVSGKVTVGTTPTASTFIEVSAVGALTDTPAWPDVFDGTDSAETITTAGVKGGICMVIATMSCVATTSDVTHYFSPFGIRKLHGDGLPVQHVVFVTHSTGVNLHATATNHAIYHTPVYATVA